MENSTTLLQKIFMEEFSPRLKWTKTDVEYWLADRVNETTWSACLIWQDNTFIPTSSDILSWRQNFFFPSNTTNEEGTECSETSTHTIQMPGDHPKERMQYSEQDENLKFIIIFIYIYNYIILFIFIIIFIYIYNYIMLFIFIIIYIYNYLYS
jgi:hypothetical protein